MALFLYESMYPTSFRGAKFWYQSGDVSSGRKTVIHEYPNKSFRYVEDLGLNLRTFEVEAIIKGDTYLIDKERLEAAMNAPGIGVLVHPFYGNVSVYPIGYSVSEPITQVGVATFRLSFAEASENTSPRVTGEVTALIANLYRELYDKVDNAIDLEWTLNFIQNIDDAVQAFDRLITNLRAIMRIGFSYVGGRDQFIKTSGNFSANTFRSAQNASVLATNFTNTIGDFDGITLDEAARFDINRAAFGLGASDTLSDSSTSLIKERNKNRRLVNGLYNLLILTNLYTASSLLTYSYVDQLDNVQAILDNAFFDLTTNNNYLLDNDLLDSITELRNEMRKFFDKIRLTVAKVTTINTPAIPMTVLAFNYYGNTDNYQELIDLNDITNPAVVKGEVRILEQ